MGRSGRERVNSMLQDWIHKYHTFCNWFYLLVDFILFFIKINISYIVCDEIIEGASHSKETQIIGDHFTYSTVTFCCWSANWQFRWNTYSQVYVWHSVQLWSTVYPHTTYEIIFFITYFGTLWMEDSIVWTNFMTGRKITKKWKWTSI